jgi:hypothetical protein
MINPTHLRNVLNLAADHLRGVPLPSLAPAQMMELWAQVGAMVAALPAAPAAPEPVAPAAP